MDRRPDLLGGDLIMLVKVLQQSKKVKAKVGEEVEIDSKLGNYLAGFGVVKILTHDKSSGYSSQLIQREELKNDEEE